MADTQVKACLLLELPPELRNRIYREAVVQDTRIVITSSGFERCNLLRTCKQTRYEALSIWLAENIFMIDVHRFDCTAARKFDNHFQHLMTTYDWSFRTKLSLNMVDLSPNWQNLIEWLRQAHAESFTAVPLPSKLKSQGNGSPQTRVLGQMFHTVKALSDHPWETVEGIVAEGRAVLELFDRRWGEDE